MWKCERNGCGFFDMLYSSGVPLAVLRKSRKKNEIFLTFKDSCIANVFSRITNKMQLYTIRLFMQNAVHISGGSSAQLQG
jgi:hypothetical protein